MLQAAEKRLEGIQSRHTGIHGGPGIKAAQRRIRKTPLVRVEAEALIHHRSDVVPRITGRTVKHRLARVAVAGPFIKNQHPAEAWEIRYGFQQRVRQKIVGRSRERIARKTRPELETTGARDAAVAALDV